MIDTHSHIYGPEFDEDRKEVVQRAKEAGITKVLLANVDLTTIAPMQTMCKEYQDFTAAAMGLHPTEINANWQQDLKPIKEELATNKYCAIGEIGIDLYWDRTFIEEQKLAMAEQMRWALDLNQPVILHIRKGFAEVFEVLKTLGASKYRGVFHCFGGGVEEARKAISLGFKLGIGGTLTYKKSTLPAIIREVGLDNILTETDAPYLPPVPHRGERNEPLFMRDTLMFLAAVFDENAQLVDEITTQNARNTFNI